METRIIKAPTFESANTAADDMLRAGEIKNLQNVSISSYEHAKPSGLVVTRWNVEITAEWANW